MSVESLLQCSALAAHRTSTESLFLALLQFGSQLFRSNTATCVFHTSNQIAAQIIHISVSTKSDILTTKALPALEGFVVTGYNDRFCFGLWFSFYTCGLQMLLGAFVAMHS